MTLMGAIPDELRSIDRWMLCADGGKRPVRCWDGEAASVSDPSDWSSFGEAESRIADGSAEHAGFVFAGDGFVGIDIDSAFDGDGGLSADALDALASCASYSEVSKSGRGLHIIVRASLPFKGRADGLGWEIYADGRWFVLTGRRIGPWRAVSDAQGAVDALVAGRFSSASAAPSARAAKPVVWKPSWRPGASKGVRVEAEWPPVAEGGRHLALVGYCGTLASWGAGIGAIGEMAARRNRLSMSPPLPDDEVAAVVRSCARYAR